MRQQSFFAELQRRHVYKVGAAYVVAGWLLAQVVTQVLPVFGVSMLGQRVLVLTVIAGFPIALVLAWLFDVTPQGIVRTDALPAEGETPRDQRERRGADRKLNYVLGVLLLLAVGYVILDHALLRRAVDAPVVDATSDKSIAVLPFANLSRDPDNAFFAEGIQDEILTRLAKIGALKVISRTSTQHYASSPDNLKEIAHQLGVANILEGSVQKVGDAVHINLQLIHAASDDHLWAESYNRKLDDVFAVEAEIAQTVAETLRAKLSGSEVKQLAERPTSNPAAYEAYLRGLAFEGRVDSLAVNAQSSIAAYQDAVKLDPGFAQAWAHLSKQQSFTWYVLEPTASRRDAARSALDTALSLNPQAPETQIADGFYQFYVTRDYAAAKARFDSLRTQSPNNPAPLHALAGIARREGQWDLSRRLFDQTIDLDPQNVFLLCNAIRTDIAVRDTATALKRSQRALELAPGNQTAIALQVVALQFEGKLEQAQALLDPVQPAIGDPVMVGTLTAQALLSRHYGPAIAILEAQLKQPETLGPLLGSFENNLADLHRLAGDVDVAAAHYRKAIAAFDTILRDDPDAGDLLSQRAWAEAGLGNQAAALADARRAIVLMPVTKDAFFGPFYEEVLARIQARFGDRDSAITALKHLLSLSYGTPPVSTALLRIDPDWDKLRDDPRFQALLSDGESAKPAAPKP